jgi:glycosyltransferase involved in cell wall biosynthesis
MGILESFALGKPVIGSNIGSIPELVEDGKNGLLFEPGNIEDLAKKIFRLYQNKELQKRLGENALNKVKERHFLDNYYSNLIKIYENLRGALKYE